MSCYKYSSLIITEHSAIIDYVNKINTIKVNSTMVSDFSPEGIIASPSKVAGLNVVQVTKGRETQLNISWAINIDGKKQLILLFVVFTWVSPVPSSALYIYRSIKLKMFSDLQELTVEKLPEWVTTIFSLLNSEILSWAELSGKIGSFDVKKKDKLFQIRFQQLKCSQFIYSAFKNNRIEVL